MFANDVPYRDVDVGRKRFNVTSYYLSKGWQADAACLGLDAEMFHPDPDNDADALPAKAICAQCPVSEVCLDYALARNEKDGVWGGTTARERRRMIRSARRRSA